MITTRRITHGLLAIATLLATSAAAEPPTPSTPLPIEADWKARADAWFTAKDDAGRREEMRAVTRALRQACRYCHTPDFTGYTDKRLISQQMMALSAEHGVECADCHGGRDALTPLGAKAAPMWRLAREKQVFCGACHVKHARFETLTEQGQRFRETEWPAWRKAHAADAPATPAPEAAPPSPGGTSPAAARPPAPSPAAAPPR